MKLFWICAIGNVSFTFLGAYLFLQHYKPLSQVFMIMGMAFFAMGIISLLFQKRKKNSKA